MSLPWMKTWIEEDDVETETLTHAECRAYGELKKKCWRRGGELPLDHDSLQKMTRLTRAEWRKAKDNVLKLFYATDTGYRHARIDSDLDKANETGYRHAQIDIELPKALLKRARQTGQRNNSYDDNDNDNEERWFTPGLTQEINRSPCPGNELDCFQQEFGREDEIFSAKKTEKIEAKRSELNDLSVIDKDLRTRYKTINQKAIEESPPIVPQSPKPTGFERTGRRGLCDVDEFEQFWNAYPRKQSKGLARRAFAKARKKVSLETILTGLKNFQWSDDPNFYPWPSSWLGGERWADEPPSNPMSES